MKNTDKYVQAYFEYISMSDEDQMDTPEGQALADKLDTLWYGFSPMEIDEIEPGLIRCKVVDRVARYLEIWSQLRGVPVNERPKELREELDYIWYDHFTEAEKSRLDKALEALG